MIVGTHAYTQEWILNLHWLTGHRQSHRNETSRTHNRQSDFGSRLARHFTQKLSFGSTDHFTILEEMISLIGEGHSASRAQKQRESQSRFQQLNALRNGRLSQPQFC